jgi:multicomponent Na+:H+ antiporter subunit F
MNEWLLAAAILLVAMIAPGAVAVRGTATDGVVAVQFAGILAALALLVMAEAFGRQPFGDLALVLAVLSFAGTLAFARFLELGR